MQDLTPLSLHPEHSQAKRHQTWVEIFRRFSGQEDWSGYEEVLEHEWHRQLHLFLYPFYYIEYGIAQLGALGLWERAKGNREKALFDYRQALSLAGARPLPELFGAAGLQFDFGPGPLARAAKTILSVLVIRNP